MISRDAKFTMLRALREAGGGPLSDDTLKGAVRGSFIGTTFAESDLDFWILELEQGGLISGTKDDLYGTVRMLTPKGTITAKKL